MGRAEISPEQVRQKVPVPDDKRPVQPQLRPDLFVFEAALVWANHVGRSVAGNVDAEEYCYAENQQRNYGLENPGDNKTPHGRPLAKINNWRCPSPQPSPSGRGSYRGARHAVPLPTLVSPSPKGRGAGGEGFKVSAPALELVRHALTVTSRLWYAERWDRRPAGRVPRSRRAAPLP